VSLNEKKPVLERPTLQSKHALRWKRRAQESHPDLEHFYLAGFREHQVEADGPFCRSLRGKGNFMMGTVIGSWLVTL
jgi:hypothetical protein